MSARKPLPENCNGSIDCPVDDHLLVKRYKNGRTWFGHIKLTAGQEKTRRERKGLKW